MNKKQLDEVTSAAVDAAKSLGHSIKKEQLEVIVKFVLGRDVFAVLPTGYGKSICYQCLPRVYNHLGHTAIIIVISPLIAIMKDQVTANSSSS